MEEKCDNRLEWRVCGWNVLRIALGVLLLVAAGLKLAGQGASAAPGLAALGSTHLQLAVAGWEFILGLWLLTDAYPVAAALAATGTFASFGGVAFYLASTGHASCACLGSVSTSPWYAFGVDLAAVVGLALLRPKLSLTAGPPAHSHRIALSTVWLLLAIAFVGLAAHRSAGRLDRAGASTKGAGNLGLEVAPNDLNVGAVWEATAFRHELTIRNRGPDELKIDSFVSPCQRVSAEPSQFALKPGDAQRVALTVDLTEFGRESRPASEEFAVRFAPQLATQEGKQRQPSGWSLRGTVRRAIKLASGEIDFGRPSVLGQPLPAQSFRVSAMRPLLGVRAVAAEPEKFAVDVRTLDGGKDFEVSVRPKAPLPIGPIDSRVAVIARLENGHEVPDISVRIRGEIRPDIQVLPEGGVSFGARAIGEMARETITVWSVTGQPIEIVSIEPESSSTRVSPGGEQSASCRSYSIEECIAAEGPRQGTVQIAVRSRGDLHRLTVPVKSHGVAQR